MAPPFPSLHAFVHQWLPKDTINNTNLIRGHSSLAHLEIRQLSPRRDKQLAQVHMVRWGRTHPLSVVGRRTQASDVRGTLLFSDRWSSAGLRGMKRSGSQPRCPSPYTSPRRALGSLTPGVGQFILSGFQIQLPSSRWQLLCPVSPETTGRMFHSRQCSPALQNILPARHTCHGEDDMVAPKTESIFWLSACDWMLCIHLNCSPLADTVSTCSSHFPKAYHGVLGLHLSLHFISSQPFWWPGRTLCIQKKVFRKPTFTF